MTSVVIPNSVTSIGGGAFCGCSGLTSVTIPNSVTSIGGDAFKNCSGLASVTVPNSVTSIGDDVFYGCKSVKYLELHCNKVGPWFGAMDSLLTVSIGEEVNEIETDAFKDCFSIDSVYISDLAAWCNINFGYNSGSTQSSNSNGSVINIFYYRTCFSNPLSYADHLFLDNKEVTDLVIPNTIEKVSAFAFYQFKGLKSVIVGNGIKVIGTCAFADCTNLTSVTIPSSVKQIYGSAFRGTSLKSVCIDDLANWCGIDFIESPTDATVYDNTGVVSWYDYSSNPLCISKNLFIGKIQITDLQIPNTVSRISKNTFIECKNLTSVTIPNSVTSIGKKAFSGCNNLSRVTSLNNNPPEISKNTFEKETNNNAILLVPKGSMNLYGMHPYWRYFLKIEELDEDVSSINTIVINEECNGSIYNLNGTKVDGNDLGKGIYIINGKKVIIK